MSNYELIKIGSEKKNDFILSWEAAFKRELSREIYEWIFNEENIKYSLVYNGELVAGYCLYPLPCIWKGSRSIALLCNNVFVCPGHQGKQLFVKISKEALNDASRNSVAKVAYGIPNSLALPGHKKVGWGVQYPVKFIEKKAISREGSPVNEWHYGTISDDVRRAFAACSEMSSKNRIFSIIKDEKFIKWRYESKPGVNYWFGFSKKKGHVSAYCVCKFYREKKVLHVVDIDGTDEDSVRSLINDIEFLPEDFDRINLWSSTIHKMLFISEGYSVSSENDNFIAIHIDDLRPVFFESCVNLCLGDNDVY
ncbi:GNAT family N-acetyltransferase [Vreelandella sulfidaeris]|uniref:GNAT family N-acetyltransferase n=1 Tax=Vreelandella sulfidaeris TaxID=115553 RepID=UPI0035E9CA89